MLICKKNKQKGQDFLEYAKEKGIEVNLQYEDEKQNSNQQKNNQNYEKKPYGQQQYNNQDRTKKPYQKNYNKPQGQGYNKKYNQHSQGQNFQKNMNFSNKFDMIQNSMMGQYQNPYISMPPQMQGYQYPYQPMPNFGMVPQEFQQNQNMLENVEKSVPETLEYYFSVENLNKDAYFRQKLNEDGFIHVNEILNFNMMKNKGITLEKIEEILSSLNDNSEIETKRDENNLYLKNKNWESIKGSLKSIDDIKKLKKLNQKDKNQTVNYVNLQNNFFYQMPPTGYQPQHMGPSGEMGQMGQMYPNAMSYMGYPEGMVPQFASQGQGSHQNYPQMNYMQNNSTPETYQNSNH